MFLSDRKQGPDSPDVFKWRVKPVHQPHRQHSIKHQFRNTFTNRALSHRGLKLGNNTIITTSM